MKKKFYKLVLVSALILAAQVTKVSAQESSRCGTDMMLQKQYAEHPELVQQMVDNENALQQLIQNMKLEKVAEHKIIVPVVFHIIHCNGPENLADANIYNAISVINTDWRKLNTDVTDVIGYGTSNNPFDTILGDMNFEFRLATIDPNGNCTTDNITDQNRCMLQCGKTR